ncbi:MAG: hypothetical protein PUE39_03460 [bacterium]|nr:hypothetical protein [bacterium]
MTNKELIEILSQCAPEAEVQEIKASDGRGNNAVRISLVVYPKPKQPDLFSPTT